MLRFIMCDELYIFSAILRPGDTLAFSLENPRLRRQAFENVEEDAPKMQQLLRFGNSRVGQQAFENLEKNAPKMYPKAGWHYSGKNHVFSRWRNWKRSVAFSTALRFLSGWYLRRPHVCPGGWLLNPPRFPKKPWEIMKMMRKSMTLKRFATTINKQSLFFMI